MKSNKEQRNAKLSLLIAVLLFGTIGIFRRYIPLSSTVIALARGVIGVVFLVLFLLIRGKGFSLQAVKGSLLWLALSGAMIGFNWILLFEAYQYTSVATATLCYYMAPIFVILFAPLLFHERLTWKKGLCVLVALVGMVFVSGVLQAGFSGAGELKGVFLGLGAAVLYAGVVLINKKIREIPGYERTVMQLAAAAIVLLPYALFTEDWSAITLTLPAGILLAIVGILHTGIAYALYFGSMKSLPTQTIALFSYVDPIVAILLSALLLGEPMDMWSIIGAVLVLGATVVSDRLGADA